jgi:hypothetical protein
VDALLDVIDWLVANKVVGIPVAAALVLALSGLAWLFKHLRGGRATFSATAPGGKVQQTNVERLRNKGGDININTRQE